MSEKLTLEEIKSLSDAALGRLLVSFGRGEYFRNVSYTDLCWSLDEVAEAEKIVIDKVYPGGYGDAILLVIDEKLDGFGSVDICRVATISARQRAEACFLALQEKE